MDQNNDTPLFYEDISSSSKKTVNKKEIPANISKGFLKHIDKIIKAISFIVAFAVLIVSIALGAVLIIIDKIFVVVAIGVLIVGIALALISLFLIYGLGHMITQNNEILKRL